MADIHKVPQPYRHLPSSDSRQDAPGASSETRELREGEEEEVPKRVLGRLEGRLELIEVAESTLLESLARERERADAAETEARMLREALARRESPWWRRLFGG